MTPVYVRLFPVKGNAVLKRLVPPGGQARPAEPLPPITMLLPALGRTDTEPVPAGITMFLLKLATLLPKERSAPVVASPSTRAPGPLPSGPFPTAGWLAPIVSVPPF